MPRHSERKARRAPSRRTSAEIVDAIVESAAALIKKAGVAGLTTNHVAERAGVSIGSLYRYFPDKESIVAELDLRYRQIAAAKFLALLPAFATDFEGTMKKAIAVFAGDHDAEIRRALMRDVPVAWVASNATKVWDVVVPAAAEAFRRIRPELGEREARLRVFVVLQAVQGVVTGFALWPVAGAPIADAFDLIAKQCAAVLLAPASDPPKP